MVASIWLRGVIVRLPSRCGGFTRNGPTWSLRSPSHPMLRQQIRNCFHPGPTNLAREGIKNQERTKKVTGNDMIKALSNYIWPKGEFLYFEINKL